MSATVIDRLCSAMQGAMISAARLGLLRILLAASPLSAAAAAGWKCASDAGCQLNGICDVASGTCKCDAQWLGQNCSRLNAGVSKAAYTGMAAGTSTWGGHPVYDEASKLWHLYAAEMTERCTLSAWTTNSIIVHATSPALMGPFAFKDIVQPAWSHNPLVTKDSGTGEILIAHIGCGRIAAGMKPKNCSRYDDAGVRRRLQDTPPLPLPLHGGPCECPHYGAKVPPHVSCQTVQIMRSAHGPDGPWTDETVAWPLLNISQWPSSLSNPTLLLPEKPGQKVLLGFNGNMAPPLNHGNTSHAGLMASRSGSWRGPYDLVNVSDDWAGSGATPPEPVRHFLDEHGHAEDEVLYRDKRGNLHMLFHGFYDLFPGGHGWTTDTVGLSGWEFSMSPAYTFSAFFGGAQVTLGQRERPQVVLQDGVITALFNGARPPHNSKFNGGNVFNMVTEICGHGPAVNGVCPPLEAAAAPPPLKTLPRAQRGG